MGTPAWLHIIQKAKTLGSKELDLGNCGLTEMPEELFEDESFCKSLTSLSFGGYFMRHEDKQTSSINEGPPNSISDIHPKIALCKNLVELSLYKNNFTKIEYLDGFTQLKILDLGTNKIETIENIQTLKKLEVLRLSSNLIKKSGGLDELSNLQFLYLGWNRLEAIENLDNLVNLESLYIGHNKITKIPDLAALQKLSLFYADANKINDCSGLKDLPNLQFINLINNQIHDIYPLLDHIKKGLRVGNREFQGNIQLERNPLTNPSAEIVARGNEHIINYFAQTMVGDDTVEINETKLLILGAGGVGKTTLALKLKDPDLPMPELKDTTVGINISINYLPVSVNGKEYKLHIWDFGGQDVYNSTHQFFLTRRSLYVLMEDGREQKNVLSYWLQAQELLAEESPILLVQNLKAGSRKDIDIGSYKMNFKNLRDYREADLSVKDQILPLWTALKAQLMQMPHFTEKLPRKWVDIKLEIEKLSKTYDHISLNKFREICADNDIGDTNRQDKLLLFLHDLGVVLNFKDIQELKRLVVIKPQWATDAVYKILDHTKKQNKQGYFTWTDLEKVWSVPQYENMFSQLLAMMQKFELCYKLTEETFIAPLLLPEGKPEFEWDNSDNLQLNYEYDFMPEGILPRLIVRLQSLIADQSKVWKRGAVFSWDNTLALVNDDFVARKIEIKAKGDNPRGLLGIISKEIDDINSKFYFSEKRNVRKMIPCICGRCSKIPPPFFYKYEVLQRWLNQLSKTTIACELSGDDVPIQKLLNNVLATPVVKEAGNEPKHKKILLILANPVGTEALNLNTEFEMIKIQQKLVKPGVFSFEFIDKVDAKRSDVTASFAENPNIVHFCGHGEGDDGIIINDEDGTKHYFKNDQLFELFETKKNVFECAVFSACKSEVQAELLSKIGIYVVGTKDKIENQTTIKFSQGFYQAVFGGNDYESAFVSGKVLAEGLNSYEAEKFVLYYNGRKIK